jgi:hypothetical protein
MKTAHKALLAHLKNSNLSITSKEGKAYLQFGSQTFEAAKYQPFSRIMKEREVHIEVQADTMVLVDDVSGKKLDWSTGRLIK